MKDPYVYEGTNVLKNKLDIKDEATLEKAESDFVGLAVYWFAFKKKTFKDLGNVFKDTFNKIFKKNI